MEAAKSHPGPADRRHPVKPFDRNLIRRFLHGKEILSLELLTDGKNNTNYKLTTNDGRIHVLRLYGSNDAAREMHVMNLVRGLLPLPEIVDSGPGWALLSFLEGRLLQDVPEHCGKAAEALAKLSSISFESPGWIEADGSVAAFPFGGLRGFVEQMLGHAEVRGWIGPARGEAIQSLLEQESSRIEELDAECRLVHGDFNPANILIRDGQVSGILDWEYAHSGSPSMDVGNLLRHLHPSLHERIRKGLEAGGMRLAADWRERAELVGLSSHLEFLASGRSDGFKRRCVGRIDRLIGNFESLGMEEGHGHGHGHGHGKDSDSL